MSSDPALTTDLISRLYRSPRYYSELLLKIKTKSADISPLFFNRAQRYLYRVVQQLRLKKKPVRILNLKARQLGMSTGISSLVYHHTATRSNVTSMISSHDQDSTNHIYSIYKLFYDKSDPLFRPMIRYSNRKELHFENPDDATRSQAPGLNSRIIVQTASNTALGRSFTIQNFHASEVAYWEDPKTVMEGVEQAVPDKADTMIYLESTANGVGNYFHDKVARAVDKKSNYHLVFIPWFWEEDYIADAQTTAALGSLCDSDQNEYGNEVELLAKHKLSREQLAWRRGKIENNFEGSVDRFRQEYPSSWEEAFIFSGQPLFNVKVLHAMKPNCETPLRSAEVLLRGDSYDLLDNSRGRLKIWEEPTRGNFYALGVDVAEGVEGADRSAIEIVNVASLRHVGEWCGYIEPDTLAYVANFLGRRYFNALLGVEVNNHGLTTVTKLHELGYWNQYKRTVFDKVKKMRRDSLGWKTTAITKPLLIDGARRAVRNGDVLLNSPDLIEELCNFVLHEDGSMGATSGKHDDRVIAFAIALEMARQTFVQKGLHHDRGPKPFTFDYFDQMADRMEKERHTPDAMGSWHVPWDG